MADLLLKQRSIGRIEGVLFDKDGTLSHSEPELLRLAESRIHAACELWQERHGDAPASRDSLLSQLRLGFGLRPNGLDPAGTLAVADRRDNLTSMATVFCLQGATWPDALCLAKESFDGVDRETEARAPLSALFPGAAALLAQLDQAGVSMAVISNDTSSGIHRFLNGHGLTDQFQAIWSADDHPKKPDPGAVQALCQKLGLNPRQCALIGDAETDLRMAHAAGIGLVIGFQGGWSLAPSLPSCSHAFQHWNEIEVGTAA